ncbi:MAG: hypothetical protein EXS09_15140 [Gemmataceae bacterium]|nr:hypothetical protein [Gemmataceae bacterium]
MSIVQKLTERGIARPPRFLPASTLPVAPDEAKVKQLLLNCLEEYYGKLDDCVVNPDATTTALREVAEVLSRYQGVL